MTNNKFLIVLTFLIACTFTGFAANAADFYGATITDKEVPTVAWRAGINGVRPIVGDVVFNSPAATYGIKRGLIILSVNNKNIKSSSELHQFQTDTLSICVIDGLERKTLIVDRLAIETEKARRMLAERKAPANQVSIPVYDRPDDSPPLKFDDYALEKRFGGSLAAQSGRGVATAKEGVSGSGENGHEGIYGDKSLAEWSSEHKALALDIKSVCTKMHRLNYKIQSIRSEYFPAEHKELIKRRDEADAEYAEAVKRLDRLIEAAAKAKVPEKFRKKKLFVVDPENRTESPSLMNIYPGS